MFWRRFIREYLPTLQICKNWNKVHRNVKQNDLALVREDNIPRSHWSLARVIETYHGKEGIVRSAKIKLPNSILTRPCNTLCILEMYVIDSLFKSRRFSLGEEYVPSRVAFKDLNYIGYMFVC